MLQYGYLLPRQPLDYNSVWDCTDCDNSQANEVIANKLSKFEEQIEGLEKDKVAGIVGYFTNHCLAVWVSVLCPHRAETNTFCPPSLLNLNKAEINKVNKLSGQTVLLLLLFPAWILRAGPEAAAVCPAREPLSHHGLQAETDWHLRPQARLRVWQAEQGGAGEEMWLLRSPPLPPERPLPGQVRVPRLPSHGEARSYAEVGTVGLAQDEGDHQLYQSVSSEVSPLYFSAQLSSTSTHSPYALRLWGRSLRSSAPSELTLWREPMDWR